MKFGRKTKKKDVKRTVSGAYPRMRRRLSLLEFLEFEKGVELLPSDVFEDEDFFIILRFGAREPGMMFYERKEMFVREYQYGTKALTLFGLKFDARFLTHGKDGDVQFGKLQRGEFGSSFELTEPKDATYLLFAFEAGSEDFGFLERDERLMCVAPRDRWDGYEFVIAPVGTRIDFRTEEIDYKLMNIRANLERYQQLYENEVKRFFHEEFEEIEYVESRDEQLKTERLEAEARRLEAEEAKKEHIQNEKNRERFLPKIARMKQQYARICEIMKHEERVNPFDAKEFIEYRGELYIFSNTDMSLLSERLERDLERLERAERYVAEFETRLYEAFSERLDEMQLSVKLSIEFPMDSSDAFDGTMFPAGEGVKCLLRENGGFFHLKVDEYGGITESRLFESDNEAEAYYEEIYGKIDSILNGLKPRFMAYKDAAEREEKYREEHPELEYQHRLEKRAFYE